MRRLGHAATMRRHVYHPCAIGSQRRPQELDDYERDLGLTPAWVTIEEALLANAAAAADADPAPWAERETRVLRWLLETGGARHRSAPAP